MHWIALRWSLDADTPDAPVLPYARSAGLVGAAVHAPRGLARRGTDARSLRLRAPVGRAVAADAPVACRQPRARRSHAGCAGRHEPDRAGPAAPVRATGKAAAGGAGRTASRHSERRARTPRPACAPGLPHLGRGGGASARRPHAALRRRAARGARRRMGPAPRKPCLAHAARRVRAEAGAARAGRDRARTHVVGQPAAVGPADLAACPPAWCARSNWSGRSISSASMA